MSINIKLLSTFFISAITINLCFLETVHANSIFDGLSNNHDPISFQSTIKDKKFSDIEYYKLLMQVCENINNEDVPKILIEEIAKKTSFTDHNYQIIIFELLHKELDVCAVQLINNIKNLNSITPMGGTLLHEAVFLDRTNLAMALLEKDVDVNIYDGRNKKALNYAASRKSFELFKALLPLTNLHESTPYTDSSYYNSLKTVILNMDPVEGSVYLDLLEEAYENHK